MVLQEINLGEKMVQADMYSRLGGKRLAKRGRQSTRRLGPKEVTREEETSKQVEGDNVGQKVTINQIIDKPDI